MDYVRWTEVLMLLVEKSSTRRKGRRISLSQTVVMVLWERPGLQPQKQHYDGVARKYYKILIFTWLKLVEQI